MKSVTSTDTTHWPSHAVSARRPADLGGRARSRRRVADLLESIATVMVVGTGVLFLTNGGGPDLITGTAAGRLIALGRLTGLTGTALLLIQLLLAARLPWIDRTYG